MVKQELKGHMDDNGPRVEGFPQGGFLLVSHHLPFQRALSNERSLKGESPFTPFCCKTQMRLILPLMIFLCFCKNLAPMLRNFCEKVAY